MEVMARTVRPEFFNLDSCQPGACDKCDAGRKAAIGDMHAALTALENAGCMVVPREATDYMLSRGLTGMDNHVPSTLNDVCIVWCELLGANPYVKEAEK